MFKKQVDRIIASGILYVNSFEITGVAKWQTHGTQNPAVATPCRFKSDPRYHKNVTQRRFSPKAFDCMNDCIFCKIIERKIPSTIVFENNHVIAIKDRAPKAPIHYLIIPKIHVKDIQSLASHDMSVAENLFAAAQKLSKDMSENGDFKFVINSGYDAGQRVFHLHAHFLVGYQAGDL